MQEFDPRRPTLRLAPKVLTAIAGLAALGLGWKLTAPDTPVTAVARAPLDAAAMAALQHNAFAGAEAQPGFDRPQSIPVQVRPGETLENAVLRTGIAPNDARQVVPPCRGRSTPSTSRPAWPSRPPSPSAATGPTVNVEAARPG